MEEKHNYHGMACAPKKEGKRQWVNNKCTDKCQHYRECEEEAKVKDLNIEHIEKVL